jgi:protein required for attachment to host cells
MPRYRKLLIVIADGEHARFVRPREDNALRSEQAIDSASAHKRSSDLGSDRPGESFHSTATAHHGVAPRHDLHDMEKEKFAALIARELNQSALAGAFETLVLVAPAHCLNAIKSGLDGSASTRLVGTLEKDLQGVPDHELWPHLREWVPPVRRQNG